MEETDRSQQFSGTEPMREGLELDAALVQRYFEEQVEDFSGRAEVMQFKGGQSNPSYKVTAGGKAWVIRRKPPGKLQPSAHAVEREYRVITALGPTDVPVPRTYALCEDPEVLGTPFYVMECVEGRVFWESLLPGMSKPERFEIYDAMNETMAKLHSVDCQAVGLEGFGKPGNYVARQTSRWGRQYQESVYERIPEMDKLITWIEERL
ncbi:MAG: phosphotransferase family protein, partial [Alphaproteobacteria bacterium]|nr:phosphotransferase family protein [Alphaproteobacteria bacterium]